ncbi:MAG: PEP-CTERM sorting domain-containing protein [Phycisphaeraceae bacterium]
MQRFSPSTHQCRLTLAATLAAALIWPAPAHAADVVWDGGGADDFWSTDENWDTDAVPSDSDDVYVGNASSSSNPVIINSAVDVNRLNIGHDAANNPESGYVTLTGGALSTAKQARIGHFAGGYGKLNIEGGTVEFVAGNSNDAWLIGLNGTGVVNISGGTVIGQGGGDETLLGTDAGNGTMSISGAANITFSESFTVGGGTGSGTLVLDGSITGGGSDVVMNRGGSNRMQFLDNSTLRAVIDQDAIDDPDVMRQILFTSTQNSSSNVLFADGSLLDLGFASGVTPASGTWTLVSTAAGLTDNGLALAPGVDAGWSFSTDGGQLTVSYIPEPTSASAMLILGGMIGLMRHRR